MKPVRSIKNQYAGINAHLHSQWQSQSGWNEFHTNHIADLTRLMRAALYPMGYTAHTEQSLQIRRMGETRAPRADVLIVDEKTLRVYQPVQSYTEDAQDLVAPIPVALGLLDEELDYHKAVAIYRTGSGPDEHGTPVAWVELLSPANKPGGGDWPHYRQKREALLSAGIVFVEMDYLHETPPTLDIVAHYRTRGVTQPPQPGAHAYRIAVIDPRPAFREGQARVRQFDVDDPLPTVNIPLNADDVLAFDFGTAYTKTFGEMLYGNEVDYRDLPLNFDRYSEADQARITARMLAVLKAARDGADLEQATPLAVESLPLATALAQLRAWA
jgi:hypothetical protein